MKRMHIVGAMLLVAAVLAIGLYSVYLLELRSARVIAPPAHVSDVWSFLEWRPMTGRFLLVKAESGEQHIMATGAHRFLASGASAYVFDQSGCLVDWSYDIGDDPRFDRHWGAQRAQSGESINTDAINEWIKSHAPSSDSMQ